MIRTIFTLTQISICLASGPKIVAEVDNISDPTTPLQKQDIYPNVAAFSTATPRPTTIVWRWWRITDSVSLKRPTSSAKPPTMTTVQNSVISSQPTAVTTTAVTAEQIDTSTPSKSQIHRENMERELKLFKGFNILQIILSGFIG
jgi:hypothetical protein